MIIKAAFGDHAAQHAVMAVEKETFSPLRKAGLLHAAENSYSDFAKMLQIEETKYTQNAYLLQYQSHFLDYGDFLSPDDINDFLSSHLRIARNVTLYSEDFLKYYGQDAPVSHDLYAAAIATPAFIHRPDNSDMIALIGEDAQILMSADKFLMGNDRARSFHDSSISPEAKLLHLIHMKISTAQVISQSWSTINDQTPVNDIDLTYIETLIEQLENINPLPKHNNLESNAFERLSELNTVYQKLALQHQEQQANPDSTLLPPNIHPI